MPRFICTISGQEVLRNFAQVTVEADTAEQARALIEQQWEDGELIDYEWEDNKILDKTKEIIDVKEAENND